MAQKTDKVFIRSPYNYDRNKLSKQTGLECTEKGKTIQSQKEQADINYIVQQFGLTGKLPENIKTPTYGDFTGITDYQSALNSVIAAEQSFMLLPAEIRTRFSNSPQRFLEFCSDPKNYEEGVKLGLMVKRPLNEPVEKGGVSPTGATGKKGKAEQEDLPIAKLDKTGS